MKKSAKYILLLAGLTACATGLVVLRWLDLHPLTLPGIPAESEVTGAAPAMRDRGDVLLVLGAPAPASRFAELDLSCAWLGLLEAEFGAVSVAGPADAAAAAERARAVVLAGSARGALPPASLDALARAGRTILVDAPADTDSAAPDASGSAALRALVVEGSRVPDAGPRGLPTHRVAARGAGRIVLFESSLARRYAGWVQGIPDDDFLLRETLGDYPGIEEPDDLVRDPALRANETPFADAAAHALAGLLDPPDAPLPRVLWTPADSDGVLLMTHDEDFRAGLRCLELMEQDQRLGLRSTFFVISVPRLREDWIVGGRDLAAEIAGRGGALGLHWNQYPMAFGVGPLEPLERVFSCADQAGRLRSLSPVTARLRTNRNHYLILGDDWTRALRVLAAQGIRMDFTYGSNKGRGFLFGTARPVLPVDVNGGLLPLRELPFVNQEDWGGADAEYFDRLFEANAASNRGTLVTLFHPHLVLETEAGRALYRSLAAAATRTRHRSMDTESYLDFWDARVAASCRSRREADALVIDVEGTHPDLEIAVPTPALRASCDGVGVAVRRLDVAGTAYAAVRAPAGRHTLRIALR